jgi:hypothetical protein
MQEAYKNFVDFVGNDLQGERRLANRRMLSVFIWCFIAPATLTIVALLLVKAGVFPRRMRNNLDWLILLFPVLYSLYILGSEAIVGIPSICRRGGLAHSLKEAQTQGEWRQRVCAQMSTLPCSPKEWTWIIESFQIDIENMRYRAKYLTVLAGAVFFLIFQGIDSISDTPDMNWLRNPAIGWIETSNEISEFAALALFLTLLYLSGSQASQSLQRYLGCAKLVSLQKTDHEK